MRPHCLLALLGLLLPLAAAASYRLDSLTGGWEPIKNINDPHVKEIAEFAVSEYNKQAQGQNKLVIDSVVRGERQVVAGINYKLVISAKNESLPKSNSNPTADEYEGIVWEKTWEHFRKLISFVKIEHSG